MDKQTSILQHYYLNIDDARLLRCIRGIQINSFSYKDKEWLCKILYEILDQRVTIETPHEKAR